MARNKDFFVNSAPKRDRSFFVKEDATPKKQNLNIDVKPVNISSFVKSVENSNAGQSARLKMEADNLQKQIQQKEQEYAKSNNISDWNKKTQAKAEIGQELNALKEKLNTTKTSISELNRGNEKLLTAEQVAENNKNAPLSQKIDKAIKYDIPKTAEKVGRTALDLGANVAVGATNAFEGMADAAVGNLGALASGVTSGFGLAPNSVSEKIKERAERFVNFNFSGEDILEEKKNEGTGIYEPKILGVKVRDALNTISNMVTSAAFGGTAGFMASAAGQNIEEALNDNQSLNRAVLYGDIAGAVEGLTEKMFDAVKLLGGGKFDKFLPKGAIGKLIGGSAGEAIEEVIADGINPFLKAMTYEKGTYDMPTLVEYLNTLKESAWNGFVIGLIMKGGQDISTPQIREQYKEEIYTAVDNSNLPDNVKQTVKDVMITPAQAQINQDLQNLRNQNPQNVNSTIQRENVTGLPKLNVQNQAQIQNNEQPNVTLPTQAEMAQNANMEQFRDTTKLITQRDEQTLQSAKIAGMTDMDIQKAKELNDMLRSGTTLKFYDPQNIPQGVDVSRAADANGFYMDGTLWINKNSKMKVERILGHELTHHVENDDLINTILDSNIFYDFLSEKGFSNTAEFKKYLKEKKGYKQEELTSEMVAHFAEEKLFGKEETINRLARENRTLAQKILNWLSDLKTKIAGSTEAKELLKIENMYRKALDQARNTTTSSETQYHISDNLSNDIDNVLANINERNPVKLRDYTPTALVQNGVKDLPMYENPSHIRKNVLTENEARNLGLQVNQNDHYHGLGKDIYIKAIDSLDDPRVVLKYKNRPNEYIILTVVKDNNNNNIIVPIEVTTDTYVNNVKIDINRIKSVYGYDRAEPDLNKYIKDNIKNNNLEKIYEKKKPSAGKTTQSTSNNSINQNDSSVNTEYAQENKKDTAGKEPAFSMPEIPKGYTRLYRGLTEEYNKNYDKRKLDNSNGYESWTDNYDLAKAYGDNVYYIDIPTSDIKNDIIDNDSKSETYGDRNLIYFNDKPVGIKGKSGNEYMLYTDHDNYSDIEYKKVTENPDIRYSMNPVEVAKNPPNIETGLDQLKRTSRVKEGDTQSSFTKNIYNQSIFDDKFKDLALDDKNIRSYASISNKETLQEANDAINEQGQKWVDRFLDKPNGEMKATDIAGGFILMNRYQQAGDYESMIRVAEKLRKAGTQQGQTIQMFSVLGRMTPEGMTYYAQKELSKAYDEILKNKTQKWADEHADEFKLNDRDIEYIQRRVNQAAKLPEGRDKYILLAEIAERIQNKIPPQPGQGVKALARNSMLLNPKTMVRNILGNVVITPSHIVSDFIGSKIDESISKKTGIRTTGGFDVKALQGAKKGFYESFDDFRRKISTREVGNDRFEISGSGRNFYENHTGKFAETRNKINKALNGLDRVTGFLLEAGDRPFYETWFINSLNNQMKLNNVTEPTAEMIEIATDEALQRTWQDNNTYTKLVNTIRQGMNNLNIKGYGLGDIVMPFVKTPANLTKAVVDFSPLGAINAAIKTSQFNKDIGKGAATAKQQREVVKAWSQVITGTLGMAIATALANAGILSGGGDEDKDVRSFEQNVLGIKPYSIKIGDTSYTYDWAQPLGTSAAMVADTVKSLKSAKDTEGKVAAILEGVQSGASVLLDQSFVSGIRNLFEEDNLINALIEAGANEPAKFTPQFLGQLAQIQDDTARTSYVYNDKIATGVNKVKAKIPGLRQTLEPSVDVLGREVKTDNSVGNVMFNPANTAFARNTKGAEEMYRVYQATGDKATIAQVAPYYFNVGSEKIVLTPKQRTQYQKTIGKIASDGVENLLKNKAYEGLEDTDKAEILKDLYSYGTAIAKAEASTSYLLPSAIQKIKDSGMSPEEYILLKYISNLGGTKKDDMYNSLISAGYSQKDTQDFLTDYKGYKFNTTSNKLPTLKQQRAKLPTLKK